MATEKPTNSLNSNSDLRFKSGVRETDFRYELLDHNFNVIRNLNNVVSASVSYSAFANIHRTADFRFREETLPDTYSAITTGDTFTTLDFPMRNWTKEYNTVLQGDQLVPRKEPELEDWNADMDGEIIGNQTKWGWSPFRPVGLNNITYDPWAQGPIRNSQGMYKNDTTFKYFGIVSDRKISRVVGRTYYYAFVSKQRRGGAPDDINTPKVWFVPSSSSSTNDWGGKRETSNHTSTNLGNGWKMWIGSWTMPSDFSNDSPYIHMAVGYEDGGAVYEMWVDSVFLREGGGQPFTFLQNAYSPQFKIDNTKITNGAAPKFKSAKLIYDKTIGQYNTLSGVNVPTSRLFARTKVGTGAWSSWQVYNSGQTLAGIPNGTTAKDILLELNWEFNRLSMSDDYPRASMIKIEVLYEEQSKPLLKDTIDYRKNLIKPYMRWNQGGTWQEAPLGIFMMNSPKRVDNGVSVFRDVQGYDLLSLLDQAKVVHPFTLKPDTTYGWSKVIKDILTGADTQVAVKFGYNFPVAKVDVPMSSASSTGKPRIYQAGESWLKVLNDLASCIGYQALHVDEGGVIHCLPYVKPSDRPVTKTYEDDSLSVTYIEAEEEYDIYNTPNVFVCTQQADTEGVRYYSRFYNTNEGSLTSIPNVGRYIVDYREVDNIDDQGTLDQYCTRVAVEASQAYGKMEFKTALMPGHTHFNAMKIKYTPLAVDDVYTETGWSMDLTNGGIMTHTARKVIKI
ncbi:hypothetical protein I2750_00095 [Bacillus sp. PR5]|nr:hypothetical protein [Bacillus sp. PR5]